MSFYPTKKQKIILLDNLGFTFKVVNNQIIFINFRESNRKRRNAGRINRYTDKPPKGTNVLKDKPPKSPKGTNLLNLLKGQTS